MINLVCLGLGIALLLALWFVLSLHADNANQRKQIDRLQTQLKQCRDAQLTKSIEEKASAWRRDRRYGDNKHGGYHVSHEEPEE